MVKPVIFAVRRTKYFPRQDSNSRQRYHPKLHFTSRSKWLEFAVDGPRREIVVEKTTVTGCVLLLGVNVPFFMKERRRILRVIFWAGGYKVPYLRTKVGANSHLGLTPSSLDTFAISLTRKYISVRSHSPNSLEHRVCFWNIFQNQKSQQLQGFIKNAFTGV